MFFPNVLLKKLYTVGSLKNTDDGARFEIKNRLADAELTAIRRIGIDGGPLALENVRIENGGGVLSAAEVDPTHPVAFAVGAVIGIRTGLKELAPGAHEIELSVEARPFGALEFKVDDTLAAEERAAGGES